jgi:hypothetical protein
MTEQRDEELSLAIKRVVVTSAEFGAGYDEFSPCDEIAADKRVEDAKTALRTLIARKVAEARESALTEVRELVWAYRCSAAESRDGIDNITDEAWHAADGEVCAAENLASDIEALQRAAKPAP